MSSLQKVKWALEPMISSNVFLYCFARSLMRKLRIMLPHEQDFEAFSLFQDRGLFLDVGANDGISALSFRCFNKESPIFCVEASKFHKKHLQGLKDSIGNLDYLICGAGDADGKLNLFTPTYRGFPLYSFRSSSQQEALQNSAQHLNFAVNNGKIKFKEEESKIQPLDNLRLQPSYIKIDVEGLEHIVLKGLKQTIDSNRPIVMVAYSDSNIQKVVSFFRDCDYIHCLFDGDRKKFQLVDLADKSASTDQSYSPKNVFFVPSERKTALAI